jgi:hypothetical protein
LHSRVDAQWLSWATATDGRGGKAKSLKRYADKLGVVLNVSWVCGAENPADRYTTCDGYQKALAGIEAAIGRLRELEVAP